MTVSTEISSNEYTGNGVTTDFDYKFRIFKANQLSVITSDADGDNVVTLRLGTDYTVTGANKSIGGKVILTKPLANGHKISIYRDIPITQETSFRNQSKFFAETHEDAFDYLTMIIQRIWGSLGSLYLKRPNILANWFDAKGYRIANLGKPKRDSDAVDLGTLKDEISGVNSTILKKEKRTLRVDDMDISAFPKALDRRNKQIGFDSSGMPTLLDPIETGALGYQLVDSFEAGALITGRYQALHFEYQGEYYRWDGDLPKKVPADSTPESTGGIVKGAWVSVGDASLRGNLGSEDGLSLIGGTNYDGLRSYTGSNDKIRIYGVNNVFDGGYGDFSLDRNDETSEDNSVTVLVDRLNRRWKRNYAGAVLPRFSGVVGDGIADDSNSCRLLIQAFKEKGVQAARGIDMQGQAIDWSGYTCKLSEPLDLSGMYNYTFINPTFTAASSFSGTELIRISSTVRYLQLDGITFINPNLDAKWNADYCIRASDFLKFMVMGGRITHYNKKGILTGEEMASAHELSLNSTFILQKDIEESYPDHVTEGEAFEINNYDNEFVNVIIAFQKSCGGTLNKGANRFIGGHIYSGKPLRSLDQSDDFVGTYFDMTPLIVKERTSVQSCVFLIGSAKYAIDLISTAPYLVKVTNNRFRSQDNMTGSVIKMKTIAEGRTIRPAIFDNQYDRCEGISTRGNLYKTINNDTETIAVPDAMLPLSSVGSVCISESVTQDYANRTFSAGYNAASKLITIRTFRIWPDGKTLPDTVSGKLVIVPVNI